MRKRLLLCACFVFYLPVRAAAPATPQVIDYFRFVLLNLGHLSDAAAIQKFEGHLTIQFGLNQQEVAQIDSAGQQMRSLLAQIQQSLATIAPSAASSPSAVAQVSNLTTQREAMIATLANQILNSVRPETATRLSVPGNIVANAVYGYGGN